MFLLATMVHSFGKRAFIFLFTKLYFDNSLLRIV